MDLGLPETAKVFTAVHQGFFVSSLVGVAQWPERRPGNRNAISVDSPSRHRPGFWAKSSVGGEREAADLAQDISAPLFYPPFPFSKNKIFKK